MITQRGGAIAITNRPKAAMMPYTPFTTSTWLGLRREK